MDFAVIGLIVMGVILLGGLIFVGMSERKIPIRSKAVSQYGDRDTPIA
jgi:preprotein translocase subunit SecY